MRKLWAVILYSVSIAVYGNTFYVDSNRPDDTGNGLSWETAKKTIQAAADAANADDCIIVTDGVYCVSGTLSNVVKVTKELTFQSVSGPEHTVIDGQHSNRCIDAASSPNTVFQGFTIQNGYTVNYPGAGCRNGCYVNCIITGNEVSDGPPYYSSIGAGVTDAVLSNCYLTGNKAIDGAAAIYSVLDSCVVASNEINGYGALMGCTVKNSWIAYNHCKRKDLNCASAAYRSTLVNCSVVWNTGRFALHSCTQFNSIVYYNGPDNLFRNTIFTESHYSCSPDVTHGRNGNITNAPDLLDGRHISTSSPCSSAGSALYVNGRDIDGEIWAYQPAMGCDQPYDTGGPMNVSVNLDTKQCAAGYDVSVSCCINGNVSSNLWSLGNGTRYTNEYLFNYAWNTAGVYNIEMTVWNYTETQTIQTQITVVDLPVFYVDAANTTPVSPYSSWETAATSIQEAADLALLPGSVVCVTDGVYHASGRVTPAGTLNNCLVITNDITVCSANGPGTATIAGKQEAEPGGPLRCVYMSDGILEGFVLSNGCTKAGLSPTNDIAGGGVFCTGGTISNCIITHCRAAGDAGGAYGAIIHDSLIKNCIGEDKGGGNACCMMYNCVVSSNALGLLKNTLYGGGTAYSFLQNCEVSYNGSFTLPDGGGCYESYIFDSVINSNTSGSAGGGISSSYAIRCLIENNAVSNSGEGGGGACNSKMANCIIRNNRVNWYKGGATGWLCYLWNCVVYGNLASMNGNTSSNFNSGVYQGILYNCIVWGNGSNDIESCVCSNVCSPDVSHGTSGNITNNPMLVDAKAGDFRLQAGSPCINAGANQFLVTYFENRLDYVSANRIVDRTVDMGAIEYTGNVAHVIQVDIEGAGTVAPQGPAKVTDGNDVEFSFSASAYSEVNGVYVDDILYGPTNSLVWTNIQNDGILRVVFAPVVTTNRGVQEYWLAQYGWTNDFYTTQEDDPDGDGMKTWEEYIAGTDPTNKHSYFCVDIERVNSGLALDWKTSKAGRIYSIYQTDDLTKGFSNLTDTVTNNSTHDWNIPETNMNSSFYKIQIHLE